MFNIFKPKTALKLKGLKKLELKIDGMHCVSCSLNIDGELEELEGVESATTSYAKAECRVEFDSGKLTQKEIVAAIQKLGYTVSAIL